MAWSPGSPITGSSGQSVSVASAVGCSAVGGLASIALLVVVGLADGRGVAAGAPGAGSVLMHPHQRGVRRDQPVQLAGGIGVSLRAG